MGSHGRSVRLRIYFLVAIPLIAMIGLLAYVTSTQVDDAINLDRAPNLINATSLPATKFGNFLETERAAAVVYLSAPSTASLQAYQTAIAATNQDEPAFKAAMTCMAQSGVASCQARNRYMPARKSRCRFSLRRRCRPTKLVCTTILSPS